MTNLSSGDIVHFERRLRAQRDQLRQRIQEDLSESDRENFNEIVGEVRDIGEESQASGTANTRLTLLRREVDELQDAEAALLRIRQGTYGECVVCGRTIERERLEAYPTAERCLDCQATRERQHVGWT